MPETEQTDNNKKRRGISKLTFILLFLPMLLLVVGIGYGLSKYRLESRVDDILRYDGIQLQLISGFLGAEVLVSLKHLRSLVAETVTRTALDTQDPAQLRLLEGSFLTLSQRNPLYQQVRWLDESGMERVRVSRDNGEPYIVAAAELQEKRDRYYFQTANRLLPGELYISRIDLNEEHGEVEMPPRPVLRIATPVSNSQRERRGIIIINIEMRYMFEFVRGMRQKDLDVQYLLINQQGILLNVDVVNALAPDGEKEGIDFAQSHPDVWEEVARNEEGSFESTDGLWSWRKLSPVERFKRLTRQFPEHLVAFDQMIADDFSVMLMAHRPIGTLEAVRQETRMLIFLGSFMVLSVYGLTLFFYLSGQARARRAEVEAAYAQERASSMERMKELEERFHLLVEASSIGQLVVDAEGRIEISNPAAEHMLGYEKGELEGVLVDALLPDALRERHRKLREEFMQMPVGRQMGVGRQLQAVRKDGSTIPVEVGLNPYSDHGRPLVLASVIDLSER